MAVWAYLNSERQVCDSNVLEDNAEVLCPQFQAVTNLKGEYVGPMSTRGHCCMSWCCPVDESVHPASGQSN
jgi:hypothetical protein